MEKPDVSLFPQTPGVYLYKDAAGHVLYVGKARRLRQRIASYFRDDKAISPKTRAMLKSAISIDILNTETEKEALLLEASLIKKHRPRYNILLRDDKEYLVFRISAHHQFPRVEVIRHTARQRKKLTGKIYGPFSSGTAARATWKLIHKYFPLRRCTDSAFKNRTRPCLYYDMGQCLAPCVLSVSTKEYHELIQKVSLILSGHSRELISALENEMHTFSENLQFEKAGKVRDQIKALKATVERQSVVLAPGTDIDLIGVAETAEGLALGVVFVRDGLLLDGRNFFWSALSVEDTPELLYSFLTQFYLANQAPLPQRIVVPWLPQPAGTKNSSFSASSTTEEASQKWVEMFSDLETTMREVKCSPITISTPKIPQEDSLVIMAASNAKEAAKIQKSPPMASLLASIFHSAKPIERIEVVDISHTGGKQTKAGMVVYKNEEPVPNHFRVYNLDDDLEKIGAEPGDDYASLAIWAKRRADAGAPWPDLVLIDGGRGQLNAVEKVFTKKDVLNNFILASIAKARHEDGRADRRAGNIEDRIFIPGRSNPLNLQAGCPELLFLQRIRDSVHDFVLGKHRHARSQAALAGELTRLPGVGPKLAKTLFDHFGSLGAMAKATEEEFMKIPGIGKERAAMLIKRLTILIQK